MSKSPNPNVNDLTIPFYGVFIGTPVGIVHYVIFPNPQLIDASLPSLLHLHKFISRGTLPFRRGTTEAEVVRCPTGPNGDGVSIYFCLKQFGGYISKGINLLKIWWHQLIHRSSAVFKDKEKSDNSIFDILYLLNWHPLKILINKTKQFYRICTRQNHKMCAKSRKWDRYGFSLNQWV
jgi:hypothetical protein